MNNAPLLLLPRQILKVVFEETSSVVYSVYMHEFEEFVMAYALIVPALVPSESNIVQRRGAARISQY